MKNKEITSSDIDQLLIKIARDNQDTTENLHIYVTLWTYFLNMSIKDAEKDDLENLKDKNDKDLGILQFNIRIQLNNLEKSPEPIAVNKLFKLQKGKDFQFTFDKKNSNVFVTQLLLDTKPDGTKRTVITYEDTDVIDENI